MKLEKQIDKLKEEKERIEKVIEYFSTIQESNRELKKNKLVIAPRIDLFGGGNLEIEFSHSTGTAYLSFDDVNFIVESLLNLIDALQGKTLEEIELKIEAIKTAKKL